MQNILLYCSSPTELEPLRGLLESRLAYTVYAVSNHNDATFTLSSKSIHLIIFETDIFDHKDSQSIQSFRTNNTNAPLLVFTREIQIIETLGLDELKTYFINKPADENSFINIVKKLITNKSIAQQRHRRYPTQQHATMETFLSGESLPSKICNLSMGGAYCEIESKEGLTVGDLVRLKVPLKEVGRHHVMNAKIVWLGRLGSSQKGPTGVGMKFIKYDDVYKHLMEKV